MATPHRGGCDGTEMANNSEMMDESRQTANEEQEPEDLRHHRPLKTLLMTAVKKVGIGKGGDKNKNNNNDKELSRPAASTPVLTLPQSALLPYYSVREEIDFRIKGKLHTEAVTLSNGDAALQVEIENEKILRYEKAVSWASCISHLVPFYSLLTNGLRKCYLEAMIWYMMCGDERFPGDATIISEFSNWYYTEVEEFDLRIEFRKTLEYFNQHEGACRETRLMLQGTLITERERIRVTMQESESEDVRREVLTMDRDSIKATIIVRKTIKMNVGKTQNLLGVEAGWRVLMKILAHFGMKLVDNGLEPHP